VASGATGPRHWQSSVSTARIGGGGTPRIFVSVASTGLTISATSLESIFTTDLVHADSKEVVCGKRVRKTISFADAEEKRLRRNDGPKKTITPARCKLDDRSGRLLPIMSYTLGVIVCQSKSGETYDSERAVADSMPAKLLNLEQPPARGGSARSTRRYSPSTFEAAVDAVATTAATLLSERVWLNVGRSSLRSFL